jgi:hypothetical protein
MILFVLRDRFMGAALLAACGVFYYIVASYESWHAASSFGNRFFIPLTPVFVLGLAFFLKEAHRLLAGALSQGAAWVLLALPLAFLVLWNTGLMFQWATGMVPRQGSVDFAAVAHNQINAVPSRIAGVALRYLGARGQLVREQERRPAE